MVEKYKSLPVQVKASFWFLVCGFLQQGISVITTPIFTRILSTEEYGQYSVFMSWYSIIILFTTLNLANGVITQGLVKYDREMDKFASSLLGLMCFCVACFFIIYIISSDFWNNLFKVSKLQMSMMFIMMWTTTLFGIWSAVQKVKYKYKSLVIVTVIAAVCNPAVGILMVMNSDDKVTSRIIGIAVVQFLCYSWLFADLKKRGKILFSKQIWKYALSFNIPLIPHFLSQIILSLADRIMIRDITTSSYAGIYSLAYSVASIMMIFHTALMSTISPWIYAKIRNDEISGIKSIAYFTLILMAGVNLLLIGFAPEAIILFAPDAYYEAIWSVPPIAMGSYFMYTYDLFAKFAFYHDQTILIMVTSVLGAVLNLCLNWYCIHKFGYLAAAYTSLVCYIFYAIVHFLLMSRVCDKYHNGIKPYNLKIIIIISLVFCLAGFGLMMTYACPVIRYGLITIGIVLGIIYRKKIIILVQMVYHLREEK